MDDMNPEELKENNIVDKMEEGDDVEKIRTNMETRQGYKTGNMSYLY